MSNEPSPSANRQSPFTRHLPLLLILTLFTALTLYNSILLPLGEADDETDHYQYLRFVARAYHPPLTEAQRQEAGFKGGLAPLYYVLTAWPIAIIGQDARPDIRRVDARPQRYIPGDGLGINHVLHTLDEQWPWRGQPLAWHIIRFFSLPMGWVTIIATYALARRLAPGAKIVAISAAAFVAFLPRFVISSAVINDDNLVFALTALLLLTQVIILQNDRPPTAKIMAACGALFGLALLTKYFSLILIPEIIFTLWVAGRKWQVAGRRGAESQVAGSKVTNSAHHAPRNAPRPSPLTPLSFLLPFLFALLLTAGPWFTFIALRFNRIDELGLIPGLAASLGEPQITEGLVGLFAGQSARPEAATYSLPEWFGLLYRSFWFEYGWMRLFAADWIYTLFTIFLLLALIGLGFKVQGSRFRVQGSGFGLARLKQALRNTQRYAALRPTPITWLLTLHLLLFALVLAARYILSATIDTGQGRHLYPALPVIALLLAIGLYQLPITIYQLFILARQRITNQEKTQDEERKTKDNEQQTTDTNHSLLPTLCYLLLAACYLLPALASLQPGAFILPRYRTIPVSAIPIALPPEQRQSIEFDHRLWLVGLQAPPTAPAGEALPVTLHWFAEAEARQDYLISLCLQNQNERPVACWHGHFDDGHYPARAWEKGDTLVDTVYLPIPACYRLAQAAYQLHLQIWALDPTTPTPTPLDPPLAQRTFAGPEITLRPTDSLKELPQTADLWQAGRRLTGYTQLDLNQSLAYLNYAANKSQPNKLPQILSNTGVNWQPLPNFTTPLYLPCDDGPTPFAYLSHFMVDPTLAAGIYQPKPVDSLPPLNLSLRDRVFAPVTATLTFSHTLAPLSLQLPNQAGVDFTNPTPQNSQLPIPNYQLPITTLPITIRWQARRWMADALVVSLKLLDKDFAVGGQRVAGLGDRYPNVLWAPTEIIEETYPLQINPNAPPGLYALEVSLLRPHEALPAGFEYLPLTRPDAPPGASNLYPLTVRLLDPAHNTPPPHPVKAQLGNSVQLTGYGLTDTNDQPIQNSQLTIQNLKLTLYWQSTQKIPADYTVFTQLIGPDGQVWAQWDNPPQAGRYPTGAWSQNDTVVDRYTLTLKEGAPAGDYRLLVGMYNPATGQRLPASLNGQPQPDDAIELTTLAFTP